MIFILRFEFNIEQNNGIDFRERFIKFYSYYDKYKKDKKYYMNNKMKRYYITVPYIIEI